MSVSWLLSLVWRLAGLPCSVGLSRRGSLLVVRCDSFGRAVAFAVAARLGVLAPGVWFRPVARVRSLGSGRGALVFVSLRWGWLSFRCGPASFFRVGRLLGPFAPCWPGAGVARGC